MAGSRVGAHHWQYGSNTPSLVHNDDRGERGPFCYEPSQS
jgi:hypothetical protein